MKPVITGDALPEPQPGAQAGMMVSPPPVAGQALISKVPVPLDELLKIAGKFSEEGRFPEAESILDHILSAAPDEPRALHQKGVLLFRMGSHQAAAEVIERSVGLAPDAIGFRRNVCPIFERLGRYDEALRIGYPVRLADTDTHVAAVGIDGHAAVPWPMMFGPVCSCTPSVVRT